MKRQPRILAGTALGLLMASAPLGAFPLQGGKSFDRMQVGANLRPNLVQADCLEGETAEDCAARAQQQPAEKPPCSDGSARRSS